VITCDGAVHRAMRASIDPCFRPRAVDAYIDRLVEPIARGQLDAIAPLGRAELMADYLEPVSVLSLGAVLGLEDLDGDTLRRWFGALAHGATNYEADPAKQVVADAAVAEIRERLAPRLARLAAEPDGSALSHLLHAGAEGRVRTVEEVMPNLLVLLLGGMQEPGHAAGSAVWALLSSPESRATVLADPASHVAAVVDEGLRLITPIGTQLRVTTRPVAFRDVTIPAGEPVALLLGAANRDPARFSAPDRFDLSRERIVHASFGFGRHFCSGHWFARQQERIALRMLLERLPEIELDAAHPAVFRGWEFRAPAHLHVRF
jgi:cytochrome P450